MKTTTIQLKPIIYIMVVMLTMSGCAAIKGWFSDGRTDLRQARSLWNNGKEAESLVHATQALITDSEYYQGKKFIHENFDEGIKRTEQKIARLGTPEVAADAEQLYYIYSNLVKVYNNLGKIELPIAHHRDKWEWTTEIVDYSQEKQDARILAFNLLMKEGREFLANGDVSGAEERFRNVVRNYSDGKEEQDSISVVIADEVVEFADNISESQDLDQAKLSHSAYQVAIRFVSNHEAARSGLEKVVVHISELYTNQGEEFEKKGDLENLLAAVKSYENALQWHKDNQQATDNLEGIKVKVAEEYYVMGVEQHEQGSNLDRAVSMYQEAQKWVPEYKDTRERIMMIDISRKALAIATNVDNIFREHETISQYSTGATNAIDNSVTTMTMVANISNSVQRTNTAMTNINRALSATRSIPKVGIVTGAIATSLDVARRPTGVVAQKFQVLDAPVINPAKSALESIQKTLHNVNGGLENSASIFTKAKEEGDNTSARIINVPDMEQLQEIDKAVVEISKNIAAAAIDLRELNKSIELVGEKVKDISKIDATVKDVSGGVNEVDKVINQIEGPLNTLNNALDREFGFSIPITGPSFKFSARQILEGPDIMKTAMDALSDMVAKAIDPILDQLKIEIPTIPGIDELAELLDEVKEIYEAVNAEHEKVQEQIASYNSNVKYIEENVSVLESRLGQFASN